MTALIQTINKYPILRCEESYFIEIKLNQKMNK